jgi:hypothetical protein
MRTFSLGNLLRRTASGEAPDGTGAGLAGIPPLQQAQPDIEREIRRSRRYERPLSMLLMLATSSNRSPDSVSGRLSSSRRAAPALGNGTRSDLPLAVPLDGSGSSAMPVVPAYAAESGLLAFLLRETLRETDLVTYITETQEFMAVLPECDDEAARQTAQRIARLLGLRSAGRLAAAAAAAAYPRDGLTLDDLIDHTRTALRREPLLLCAGAVIPMGIYA